MRLAIAIACLLVVCVPAVWAAPPTGGGAAVRPSLVIKPDLVVKQVRVSHAPGDAPTYVFTITVANIGTQDVGVGTVTGLVAISPFMHEGRQRYATGVPGSSATPAIKAQAEAVVTITAPVPRAALYLFVKADFPTPTSPFGVVNESEEGNNVLVVPLDTSVPFPQTFQ